MYLTQELSPSGEELSPGDVRGVLFTKNAIFCVFAEQVLLGIGFVSPGVRFLTFGRWAPQIFLVCSVFVKLWFPIR